MRRLARVFTFAVALAALAPGATAHASTILYDNGFNGTAQAYTINFGFAVGDSFDLSSASTVDGVNFWTWLVPGDSVTSVDWAIADGPELTGTIYGSGTASTSYTTVGTNGFGYEIGEVSFAVPSLSLGAGTYWLVLQNAVSSSGNPVFWDESGGSSAAWESLVGYMTLGNDCGGLSSNGLASCSESFQIVGSTGTAPEPASLFLIGAGLAGAALRRRLHV